MSGKRPNTTATHFHHIDRVHSKRIIELATGICEIATDLGKMSYSECVAEQRALTDATVPIQQQLIAAKREGRGGDVILIGNRIEALNRRLGAVKLRIKELHSCRAGEGKRFLKAAMREMLTADQVAALFQRANELEAAAGQGREAIQ